MSVDPANPGVDERYEDTPRGWAQRWRMEFDAADKEHHDWHDKAKKIVDRFLDKRDGKNMPAGIDTRLNVFTASVQTKRAMLYGKIPKVDVRNRFADAPDSAARVASEILERVLNSDIEKDTDAFRDALENGLMDRLLPGVAFARFRYEAELETKEGKPAKYDDDGTEMAPEVPETDEKSYEEVETDYVHWQDVLWSPCRTFQEMRWCAFRAQLTRGQLGDKFGKEVAGKIGLNTNKDAGSTDAKKADPWSRADVWEIWDKEHKCVWFFIAGHNEVLRRVDIDEAEFNENGSQKDPLGLSGFWCFARPMMANLTTSAFLPRADFTIYQDLLDEIDRVSTRITELERAIGAKGVYDKNASSSLGRLLTETISNDMLPIANWNQFAEKGGFKGCFELMPLDGLVAALDRLCAYRQELMQQYYQISGDSDLSRGQQVENGTPGEAQVKAKFASIRMQALLDEFARWATDGQKIRAEIISKHFDAKTIFERSNIQHSFEADTPQLVMQAIQLIKSDISCYRVEIKPEALSMTDFDQLKSERAEVLGAIGGFLTSAAPLAQLMPGSMPYLLKMLQWSLNGLRGAQSIEGVIDQAITHAEQMPPQAPQGQPPGPDPKMIANQQKAQADMAKIQAQTQSELVRMNAETQALQQRKLTDAAINVKEAQAKKVIAGNGAAPAMLGGGLPG